MAGKIPALGPYRIHRALQFKQLQGTKDLGGVRTRKLRRVIGIVPFTDENEVILIRQFRPR